MIHCVLVCFLKLGLLSENDGTLDQQLEACRGEPKFSWGPLVPGRQDPNSDLWAQLQEAMRSRTARTHWKHVYTHIGILGNERAESLANQGCSNHPGRAQYLCESQAR